MIRFTAFVVLTLIVWVRLVPWLIAGLTYEELPDGRMRVAVVRSLVDNWECILVVAIYFLLVSALFFFAKSEEQGEDNRTGQ
jgi:hypothetical protein